MERIINQEKVRSTLETSREKNNLKRYFGEGSWSSALCILCAEMAFAAHDWKRTPNLATFDKWLTKANPKIIDLCGTLILAVC